MTTYGLTSTGFVSKPLMVIKSELEADWQTTFGQSVDLDPASPDGQVIGIFAERFSEIWDALEEVNAALDPDSAETAALDAVCAMTGTVRAGALHSTVTLTLTGTTSTVVPAGSQVSVTGTGIKFETLAEATISGATSVSAQSVETGPKVAMAGTLTVIETPVDGWTGVTNASDATLGRDSESDATLRGRRLTELRTGASAALEAIRARVLEVAGVTGCAVFENTSMTTDGDGLPAKSVEVVVSGTPTSVATLRGAILGTASDPRGVAAGIEIYGTSSGTVTDSMGISHTVPYSPATTVDVWVDLDITVDSTQWPIDGETRVETAVLTDYADALIMGQDVIARAIGAKVFAIPGVIDCAVTVGTSNPPGSTSVTIDRRQIADLALTRLTKAITPGSW